MERVATGLSEDCARRLPTSDPNLSCFPASSNYRPPVWDERRRARSPGILHRPGIAAAILALRSTTSPRSWSIPMAKQKGKQPEREAQGLGSYLLPMLLSAAVGAGVTWVVMSQRSPTVEPRPASFVTAPSSQNNLAPLPPDLSKSSPADAAVVRA